jgi:hypothetical protein
MFRFTFQPLYTRWRSLWYSMDRGLGGSQSRFGCWDLARPNLDSSVVQLVAKSPYRVILAPIKTEDRAELSARLTKENTQKRQPASCSDFQIRFHKNARVDWLIHYTDWATGCMTGKLEVSVFGTTFRPTLEPTASLPANEYRGSFLESKVVSVWPLHSAAGRARQEIFLQKKTMAHSGL